MKTLTKEQKKALALQARNLSAIRRLKERYAKQESEQVIDFQNEMPENGTRTEVKDNVSRS